MLDEGTESLQEWIEGRGSIHLAKCPVVVAVADLGLADVVVCLSLLMMKMTLKSSQRLLVIMLHP